MFSSRPLSSRGRWFALSVATVVLQFAYWPIVSSMVVTGSGLEDGLWLGLGVTPLVFLVLAFLSRNPRAPTASLAAMGMFLVVGLSVGLASIVLGLAAGFGAGTVVALRREPDQHPLKARWIAVAAASAYLLVLLGLSTLLDGAGEFAMMSGAFIPLAVVGIADEVSASKREAEADV